MTTLTDEELLTQYKESGDAEYFGVLYDQYIPLLYGMYLKHLHDKVKAHDAVIGLFDDLLSGINNYEIDQFKPWLYRIACNYCVQILQKENKEVPIDIDGEWTNSDEILDLLSEECNDHEQMQVLHNHLGRLPDGQRISIIHFFINKMSYADIAEKTGYSLHTVKSNIKNGKRSLRNCIKKYPK